ncbi:DNA-binding protein [Mariprofundus ferrooxydans]|nr:DNA-binding protein [Mariprofundus ferrooxydans]
MPASELAGLPGLPGTDRGIRKLADREGWQSRKRQKGKGLEYSPSSLPEVTRTHLAHLSVKAAMDEVSKQPEYAQYAEAEPVESIPGVKTREMLDEEAAEHRRLIARGIAEFASIPAGHRRKKKAIARRWIMTALGNFIRDHKCSRTAAYHGLSAAIESGEYALPEWVQAEMPTYRGQQSLKPATLAKWDADYREKGIMALTDGYGNRKHQSIIETNEGLFRLVIGAMIKAPQITGKAMIEFIEATNRLRAPTADAPALPVPSQRAYERFRGSWIAENKQIWTKIINPDQWKNVYMSAAGSHTENINRLNQLWELDSTPADWLLTDGRHSVVGVIDMDSKRLKYYVSKTSKSMAVCQVTRRAILDWGVPEGVRTDNGKDYVSDQYDMVLDGLTIAHQVCIPFASEEKGTIERVMRTMSHGILNLLPGFIGHNVAERKAIEARKSFSARLMTHGEIVEVEMTAADLQQHLDDWCEHYYGNDKHAGLGMSPNQKARSYRGTIRRIEDERALDMLLCEIGGVRRIGKKGVRFENHTYFNDEIGQYIGKNALLKYDEQDIGRLYAYVEDRFIGVLLCHEILGISRQEAAVAVKSKQKKLLAEQTKEYRAFSKEIKTNMAETVLEHRIAESENIVSIPHRSEVHRTTGLHEAGRAARNGEDVIKPLSEREQVEFERLKAADSEAENVTSILEFGDDPVRNFRLWETLQARDARGDQLKPREREMMVSYARSNEYVAMKKFNEAE